jgi:hypothetical protein
MLSSVALLSGLPLLILSSPVHHQASDSFAFKAQHGNNIQRDLSSTQTLAVLTSQAPTSTITSVSSAMADTATSTAVALFLPPDYASPTPAALTPENTQTERPLVMAYYPDWAGSTFPPEKVDFKRFDWIDFAFALPDQNFNLTWDDPSGAPALLRRLVNAAHANGKKVKLSVGGWTGSQ